MNENHKSLSRRKFLQMTSGLTAGALLAACQPAPTAAPKPAATQAPATAAPPKQPVKLRWWSGVADANGPANAAKAWNAANPDIQVEHVQYSNNDEGNVKLDTALLVPGEVDVAVTYGFHRWQKRIEAGLFEPLDGYLQGFDPEKEFGKLPMKINGKVWGFIAQAQPWFVFINKKMFDEKSIKVPTAWTWDEFRDIGMKLTSGSGVQKRYGAFLSQLMSLALVSYVKGGDYAFKDACTTAYDDPFVTRVMEQRVQYEQVDKFCYPRPEVIAGKLQEQSEFFQGKVGMVMIGSWFLRHTKNTKELPRDFQTTFAPLPTFPDVPYNYRPGGVDDDTSISAKGPNKAAAYKFAKWWCTEGYLYMVQYGRPGTWKGLKPDEIIKAYQTDFADFDKYVDAAALKPIMESTKDFPVPTNMTAAAELGTIVLEEFEKAMLGESKPAAAAAAMKKRGDEAVAKVCKK
jgi:multiple sugar transport system substrate-binding protein